MAGFEINSGSGFYDSMPKAAVFSSDGEVENISKLKRVASGTISKIENYSSGTRIEIEKWIVENPTFTDAEQLQFFPDYENYKKRCAGQDLSERTFYDSQGNKIIKSASVQRVGERHAKSAMKRRVAPGVPGYQYTIGYNKICSYYSAGFDVPKFSGSSLNRKFKKEYDESKEKMVDTKVKSLVGMAGKGNWTIDERFEYDREILELRIAAKAKCVASGRGNNTIEEGSGNADTCTVCGCELSVCVCDFTLSAKPVHVLSPRSRGKVKDKATAFFRACNGRATFCTLTFVDKVSDNAGVSILNKFLTQLRKKFSTLKYLWVAERQNNNQKFPGNIHFHIIFNRRLSVKVYNSLWVICQYNAGLQAVDKYGDIISYERILSAHKNKEMQSLLNPFDIKRVQTIHRLSWYLTKYITKNNTHEGVKDGYDCLAWHCSRGVSKLFTRTLASRSSFVAAKGSKNFAVNKSTGECYYPSVVVKSFWQMIYINNKNFPLQYLREMEQVNKWLLSGEFVFSSWQDFPVVSEGDYTKYYLSEN